MTKRKALQDLHSEYCQRCQYRHSPYVPCDIAAKLRSGRFEATDYRLDQADCRNIVGSSRNLVKSPNSVPDSEKSSSAFTPSGRLRTAWNATMRRYERGARAADRLKRMLASSISRPQDIVVGPDVHTQQPTTTEPIIDRSSGRSK